MKEELTKARDALRNASTEATVTDDLRTYFDIVARICRNPHAAVSSEFREFIRDTVPLIEAAMVPFGKYMREAERFIAQEFYQG